MQSISRELTFKVHNDNRPHPEDVRGELYYRSTDPYVVQAKFPHGVEWLWGRNMLLDAFSGMVGGEGDISMQPFPFRRQPGMTVDRILINISTPDGHAKISVDAIQLAGFLADTVRIVARDAEARRVDVDAELRAMIEQEQV